MGISGCTLLLVGGVILLLACLLIPTQATLTKSRYYQMCRENAEDNHLHHHFTERPEALFLLHGKYRSIVLRHSDVNTSLIQPKVESVVGNSTCPSLLSLGEGPVYECPSYTELEVDGNRFPNTLRQVKCSCLTCQGPWRDKLKLNICTPKFKFINVIRAIEIRPSGERIYAQVWEPVSYACVCAKLKLKNWFVMPH